MADSDDKALVRAVLRRIEARMVDPYSLGGLSEVEADLMCGVTAKGMIDNGGHVYWYEEMDRDKTLRAVDAFDRMGARSAANALRQTLEGFPGGVPTSGYLSDHREKLMSAFSASDNTIWDLDFYAVAAEYIRARRSDLLASDPALSKAVPALCVQ